MSSRNHPVHAAAVSRQPPKCADKPHIEIKRESGKVAGCNIEGPKCPRCIYEVLKKVK